MRGTVAATVLAAAMASPLLPHAIEITQTRGWCECVGASWTPVKGAAAYKVVCTGPAGDAVEVDRELVRHYPGCVRVDVPGIAPGEYTLTVTALDPDGAELEVAETSVLTATPFVREGFAFADGCTPGAYKADGTPKDGARIVYVTPTTAKTVTLDLAKDAKGTLQTGVGLDGILKIKRMGYDKTPLIVRVEGCITAGDVANLKGGNSVDLTGANSGSRMTENVTIEGVGDDAVLKGFGLFVKRCHGIEVRNLGIMLFGGDGISMEYDNSNIWVHHCDFFYGMPGKDSDQSKGDGTIDMKYSTTCVTIDHNHFFDSGKTTFAGSVDEPVPAWYTYHHNWFDHCDSRCPRLCNSKVHIYNNYFDANATMCLLSTERSSAFVEANYYRNCPSPMEINMQGTNRRRWPDGSQDGGMNKAWANAYEGEYVLLTQHDDPMDFDAYVADSRDEQVPSSVVSLKGGNAYDNFDTSESMYAYLPHPAADVPGVVMANAGRMDGGDFKWTFDNAVDDSHTAVNQPLKDALLGYEGRMLQGDAFSGIGIVPAAVGEDEAEAVLFDLSGRCLGRQKECRTPKGVYLVKTREGVRKSRLDNIY